MIFLFSKQGIRMTLVGLIVSLGVIVFHPSGAWTEPVSPADAGAAAPVYLIQLDDDTINPVTAEYISHAIDQAEAGAQALIIKLDTPGGLLNSTRTIVKRILAAKIPVIVYVAPGGSRAGSAGVFITYAAHIAAMAPSTNIGAAHPVQMGEGPAKEKDPWDGLKELLERTAKDKAEQLTKRTSSPETGTPADQEPRSDTIPQSPGDPVNSDENIEPDSDPMGSKILQDTTAFIRSLAQKRGRNAEWAVKSVTKSSSITESEALQLGVVDIVAKSDSDLLSQLDGRVVKILNQDIVLKTKTAPVKTLPMAARQKFLNILANPNVAYILLILGFYGLLYEVTHPGLAAPGVLGAVFLILAFFSMQTLPTNYAGLALIILGLILFVAEALTPGMGLWTLGGIIIMVLGSLLLFDTANPVMRVSLSLIFSFVATTAAITLLLVRAVLRAHRRKTTTGQEGMIGEKGEVAREVSPGNEGKVYVHGELWNATAQETIAPGEKIIVTKIDGMLLTVKRYQS